MRNPSDLSSMACPVQYRSLGQFHRYYSGERRAPVMTIVIGGNHESSAYLWELYVPPPSPLSRSRLWVKGLIE